MASFMLLLHTQTNRPAQVKSDPEYFTRVTREYMEWADRMRAQGTLKGGSKLTDDAGRVLRASNGKVATTDGPYAESKEIVGGFFIVAANDYGEACRIAESCPHVKYGAYIEVRQVQDL